MISSFRRNFPLSKMFQCSTLLNHRIKRRKFFPEMFFLQKKTMTEAEECVSCVYMCVCGCCVFVYVVYACAVCDVHVDTCVVCTHAYMCTGTCLCICVLMCACVLCANMCMYVYALMSVCACACAYVSICTCVLYICIWVLNTFQSRIIKYYGKT